MAEYTNPCGGVRWRTLSDGRIELEDGTVPSFGLTSAEAKQLLLTWQNWSSEFRGASERTGVPVEWIVAVAAMETGGYAANKEKQRTISSFDGSIGIMQPLAAVAHMFGYTSEDRYDAYKNIDMSTRLLRSNAQTKNGAHGFPVVASMFNGGQANGGCNTGNDKFNLKGWVKPGSPGTARYATDAIKYLNTAIEAGWMATTGLPVAAIGIGLALAGIGAATALWIARGR